MTDDDIIAMAYTVAWTPESAIKFAREIERKSREEALRDAGLLLVDDESFGKLTKDCQGRPVYFNASGEVWPKSYNQRQHPTG
jgi:hypothetical protein